MNAQRLAQPGRPFEPFDDPGHLPLKRELRSEEESNRAGSDEQRVLHGSSLKVTVTVCLTVTVMFRKRIGCRVTQACEAEGEMPGLRERKKAQTRQEIVDAALALFEEKGFEETTIDDVAAAAQVSPRTVFRYFTSKEDLVFNGQDEELRQVAALTREVAPSADPIGAILRATRQVLESSPATSEQLVRSHRLVAKTPALRAFQGRIFQQVEELILGALAPAHATREELLRVRMLAAVYVAATNVATSSWIERGAKGQPIAELELVETLLRRAFPEPFPAARSKRR